MKRVVNRNCNGFLIHEINLIIEYNTQSIQVHFKLNLDVKYSFTLSKFLLEHINKNSIQ